jgi:hypothetical protein
MDMEPQPQFQPTSQLTHRQFLLFGGIILLVVFLVYRNALDNFFIGDDFPWLYHVIKMRRDFWPALWERYNWTMSCLTFYLDFLLAGTSPWSYNLTNLLIHLGNTALVGVVGYEISRSRLAGLLTMLLWGLNAQGTEAILWKTGRGHSLALLFMLAALTSFIVWERRKRRWLVPVMLLSAVCAHLALSNGVMLPALIGAYLLVEHGFPRTRRAAWQAITHLAPFVVITGLYLAAYFLIYTPLPTSAYYGEDMSFPVKFGRNVFQYLIVFPDYFVQITYNETVTRICAILTLIAYVAALFLVKQKIIRFGLIFMLLVMLPYLPVPLSVNYQPSRYRYVPLVGFSLALAGTLMHLAAFRRSSPGIRRWITIGICGLLCIFVGGNLYYITLDDMDYDRFGATHAQLVELAQQVLPQIPLDRPLVFVNTSNVNAGALDFEQLYKPKLWFVRGAGPWKIVHIDDLLTVGLYANHQTGIFVTQAWSDISEEMVNEHYTVLAFADTGFYFPTVEPAHIMELAEMIEDAATQRRIMALRYLP